MVNLRTVESRDCVQTYEQGRGAMEVVQYPGLVAAGQRAVTRTGGREVMWQESEPRASIS